MERGAVLAFAISGNNGRYQVGPHRNFAAAAAMTDRTSAFLPVHIFGYPADMPSLEQLAQQRSLWLVEDACEALGAVHPRTSTESRRRAPNTRCVGGAFPQCWGKALGPARVAGMGAP